MLAESDASANTPPKSKNRPYKNRRYAVRPLEVCPDHGRTFYPGSGCRVPAGLKVVHPDHDDEAIMVETPTVGPPRPKAADRVAPGYRRGTLRANVSNMRYR